MSEQPEQIKPNDAPEVPLAKPAGGGAEFGPRPIFDIEEDRCPKCGTVMPSAAVVCVKCGYDQRANIVREVETGVVESGSTPPAERGPPRPKLSAEAESIAVDASKPEFVQPGRIGVRALVIVGGVATVAAMVAAGVWGPRGGFWVVAAWVVFTLYLVAVNTVTGVAAVAVAARMNGQPFGRLDLAAARMFAAFALFQAVSSMRPSLGYSAFTVGVPYLAAAGLYFGAIMLLFRKDRATALLIAAGHFMLWLLLQLGPVLAGVVSVAGQAAKPPA